MLEADIHAKVQMRKKVRGLRAIEKAILEERQPPTDAPQAPPAEPAPESAGAVVLDYCSAIRGILNDDQGGPL